MFQKDLLLTMDSRATSPHNLIPKLIKENSIVLDVGCNTGFLGKKLREKGIVSDGIDINEEALREAKKYYRKVFRRDLYNPNLKLNNNKYNYIVFSDVLEHLPRPDILLTRCRKYLEKDGLIIISMPNIARIQIRLGLLFGKFDYTRGGILGEDHLRFFTKKSATKMIENCGYNVIKVIPTGIGNRIKFFSTLIAFQFIYVCKINHSHI